MVVLVAVALPMADGTLFDIMPRLRVTDAIMAARRVGRHSSAAVFFTTAGEPSPPPKLSEGGLRLIGLLNIALG